MASSSQREDGQQRFDDYAHHHADEISLARLRAEYDRMLGVASTQREVLERQRVQHELKLREQEEAITAEFRQERVNFTRELHDARDQFVLELTRRAEEERVMMAQAVARAAVALRDAKPTNGFLGIQIGETGTARKMEAILGDLEAELTEAKNSTESWIAEQDKLLTAAIDEGGRVTGTGHRGSV